MPRTSAEEAAYAACEDRAWVHGIRLARDMGPNQRGIDSRWVTSIGVVYVGPGAAYPGYLFTGPTVAQNQGTGSARGQLLG